MARGVLVTGGAHGIGKQICLDFLSLGDFVCFIDIDEEKSCEFEKSHPNLFLWWCGKFSNFEGVRRVCNKEIRSNRCVS